MPKNKEKDEYYTVGELADMLKVNPMTLYNYVRDGKLKAVRVGRAVRIEKDEVDKMLNKKDNE